MWLIYSIYWQEKKYVVIQLQLSQNNLYFPEVIYSICSKNNQNQCLNKPLKKSVHFHQIFTLGNYNSWLKTEYSRGKIFMNENTNHQHTEIHYSFVLLKSKAQSGGNISHNNNSQCMIKYWEQGIKAVTKLQHDTHTIMQVSGYSVHGM